MKKIIFIIGLLILIPHFCWSQKIINPPTKKTQTKKEASKTTTQKSTNKKKSTNKNKSHQQPAQKSNTQPSKAILNPPQVSSNDESLISHDIVINGIPLIWNGATDAQKSAITSLLNNMVFVNGGSFFMGSDDFEAYDDEKPVHSVSVNPFWIDKYEVTQYLWNAIMDYNPSHFKGDNRPVEQVSWNACQDFIRRLNQLTGLNFRLPTEAEWEYAARGGDRTSNRWKYSGDSRAEYVGWIKSNSDAKTHPVGTKNPNDLGLYDMTGNVWEWTSDNWSSNYNSGRNNSSYVYRGGSWDNHPIHSRVAYRGGLEGSSINANLGFRLVLPDQDSNLNNKRTNNINKMNKNLIGN